MLRPHFDLRGAVSALCTDVPGHAGRIEETAGKPLQLLMPLRRDPGIRRSWRD